MVNQFRCPYCNKSYARESWFRKHACEKRRRFELIHRMDFRRALSAYSHWCQRNGFNRRGKEITAKEFIDSHYYNAFTRLVQFTTENWVISTLRYLDFLIDMRVAEPKWTTEEILKAYRDHIRRNEDPLVQSRVTVEAIRKWCERNNIDRREFFSKVTPGAALQMVMSNQISPWVLFGYDRARDDLLNRVTDDWLCTIDQFLNNAYWINRLKGSDDIQSSIQAECERLFADE